MQPFIGLSILVFMGLAGYLDLGMLDIWVTPLAWYGYILLVDWLAAQRKGPSLLTGDRTEFFAMLPVSVLLWYLFEFHNLLFQNWEYVGLPDSYIVTGFAMVISFATILPALVVTHEFLQTFSFFQKGVRPHRFSRTSLYGFMAAGGFFILVPVFYASRYTGPLVWLGYLLFFPALNLRLGITGVLSERAGGSISQTLTLGTAGLICGLVWECLNYGAGARWIYHVPYWSHLKIFEMPVLGFLGFFPFGIAFVEMYRFIKYAGGPFLLGRSRPEREKRG